MLQNKLRTDNFLDAYPVLRTTDRDLLVSELRRAYNIREITFPKDKGHFFVVANRAQLRGTTLHYRRFGAPVRVAFADMEGFRQPMVISGAASIGFSGTDIALSDRTTCMVPPQSNHINSYGNNYAQLLLQFDERALTKHLELLAGGPIRTGLSACPTPPLAVKGLSRLRAIAFALAVHLNEREAALRVTVVELEQALKTSFLFENRFNALLVEQPKFGPDRDVTRLEDYIHENWNQPLTVEDIARECSVSVRSVYARFQKKNGCTPMAYVRDVRLEHAHRLFQSRDDNVSIQSVAMQCGFSSFGHFARRYKEKFGELPSATVERVSASRLWR